MGGINSNMENFLKMRNKTILCFGAGSYFRVMYHDFKDRDPDFKVAGIIDNNVDKLGKTIKILSDSIPVFSVDFVCQHFKPQTVVIFITTAFHQEVMEQLKRITFFQDVEIYSYYEIKKNNTEDYTALEVSLSEPVIPKKIHYCWFGGKPMPVHLQRQVESWRNFCPDYEFICWNETNYDVYKNTYTADAYQNKRWAHLPDYVRLDVVYTHGGIYMDTDVELLQSLDILRHNEAFWGTEVSGGINEGSGFGAVKGHFLVRELMKVYERLQVRDPLWLTTSLGKEIGVFHKYGYINNGKFQVLNGAAIYPYQVLAPVIKETGECMRTPATVGIHHFEGSWW
ncbi:MAG: hypothetical protein HFI94_04660 [Lachnospiraceae bacterium]|nr:hypothetical protein [Lachnospiraceae bacterium]